MSLSRNTECAAATGVYTGFMVALVIHLRGGFDDFDRHTKALIMLSLAIGFGALGGGLMYAKNRFFKPKNPILAEPLLLDNDSTNQENITMQI